MQPFSFDKDYVQRLIMGDPATEHHFVEYFSGLLLVKLRFMLRSEDEVHDLRQEVFERVLRSLRKGLVLQKPEHLGAYVNGTCKNVVLEHLRKRAKTVQWSENMPEPRDPAIDLERELIAGQSQEHVRAVLKELAPRDRDILRAVFLEDRDKDAVCREFGVGRGYLRVLLYRAKSRLRQLLTDSKPTAVKGTANSGAYS
jgi:RNA polymerase sigma-70 factor, ECF subfamily